MKMKSRKNKRSAKRHAFDLAGKVALITGGASGIGRDCARVLAGAGARVVVADVDEARSASLMAELDKTGAKARFVCADVTRPEEVKELVTAIVRRYGRLDFALNNAGIDGDRALTADYSLEIWERVLAVNLTGVFLCLKHELEVMARHAVVLLVQVEGVVADLVLVRLIERDGANGFILHEWFWLKRTGDAPW